ncbi:uncharacterized protein EDB93DRAFT_1252570 [Suillus bovinus]|uniref:uncharacterized protein n=1 Tax=Suillus bovinus TaxID=48563 RepID=UPI001B886951|nr:uncharacterized protein EDB93DRAFT_1252570 [Suillus bovinus]KAG2141424.1 hypothetical protein EDB93DRAFT_1252570 [Suillus bovinus]
MFKVSKLVTSSDGCQIYAEGVGNLEGPTIVLLLSKVYLLRYDMRSHGRSGRPVNQSDYSSPKFAEDFMAAVEGFNRQKPHLLGWSLGATVATDDVADALKARIDFVDSTINNCNASNWDDRLLCVGAFGHLNAMSRQQDPEPLLDAGSKGLGLLHLYGDADKQLDNAVAEAQRAETDNTDEAPWKERKYANQHGPDAAYQTDFPAIHMMVMSKTLAELVWFGHSTRASAGHTIASFIVVAITSFIIDHK